MTDYPLRHLSIRVPWHDAGWDGKICAAPHLNGACAKLKHIAENKKDEDEQLRAGESLKDLPPEQWPCCVDERAMFMAPFEMDQEKRHALAAVVTAFQNSSSVSTESTVSPSSHFLRIMAFLPCFMARSQARTAHKRAHHYTGWRGPQQRTGHPSSAPGGI